MIARAALLLAVLGLSSPAWSYDEQKYAEYQQLHERLLSLTERNQWEGVDRTYQEMLDKKLPLTKEDHLMAVAAARQSGDVGALQRRYERALDLWPDIELRQELAKIQRQYGKVLLLAPASDAELKADERPFQTDLAASIDFAGARLNESGRYQGVLPVGGYKLNGEPFSVSVLQDELKVKVKGGTDEVTPDPLTGPTDPGNGGGGPNMAKVGMFGGAGAVLIGAGVLQMIANGAKAEFGDAREEDEIDRLAAKANGLQWAAIGTGVAAVGLGVTAAVVVEF